MDSLYYLFFLLAFLVKIWYYYCIVKIGELYMGNKYFGIIVSILTLIIVMIGATFAYFSATIRGDKDLETQSFKFSLNMSVTPEFGGKGLIPMNDSDLSKAYNNRCVDVNGNNACTAFRISLINNGDDLSLTGNMDFNKLDVVNMSYAIMDSDGNIYKEATSTGDGTNLSLGNSFDLKKGEVKDFILVIWLSNLDVEQDEEDASGSFSASITYQALDGSKLSANIYQ